MAMDAIKGAVFSYCDTDHPVDLLEGAASVTCFLSNVAARFHEEGMELGLSEKGANGLVMILHGVENTINLALKRM